MGLVSEVEQVEQARKRKIARLNDRLRIFGEGKGGCYISDGIRAYGEKFVQDALMLVAAFEDFSDLNDPLGEHDFGSVTHQGKTVIWRIDYFDSENKYIAKDPADPEQTTRRLTIMLAGEHLPGHDL